jgi:hypothetical protein
MSLEGCPDIERDMKWCNSTGTKYQQQCYAVDRTILQLIMQYIPCALLSQQTNTMLDT